MVAACLLFVGIDAQAADPATNALPTNGQVAAGNASISTAGTAAAPVMNINQTSQRAVVNWEKFDVGAAATVNFNQPNAQASTLNRVSDANPSKIFGKINAPGEVILVNQAGVYFSPSSSLDVGAVVATTHNISDADHMAGKATYDRNGATGKVINEGNIKTALGGYVALLAPEVRNSGVIVAQMGTVVLAAGERVTLNFDASRHLASITTTPSTIDALIENRNAVKAPGGLIILSAKAVNTLTAGVIKQSGTLSASADANTITNKGGRILLTASTVKLEAGSQTLARGPAGGGNVEITATQTATVEGTAKVSVSATQTGDAGTITIHADEKTTINGTLLAQGGKQSGNGGTINTTSNGQVEIGNTASVKAGVRGASSTTASGNVGSWNVTAAAMQINTTNAGVISQSLNTNNVAIKANVTQLSIAADAVIQKTSPVLTSLNLEGAQSVTIAGQILSSPLSPITLQILSQNSVELQQTSSIQSREVLVAAPNINSVGDVYAYLFGGNNGAIPLISFLASRISVAGNLRAGSNLRAGKISFLGTDEVAITNANISANDNDGGEIQIISMNGTVNLTNSVVQTNGGEGRGGAISVAGLQSTILSESTLEATGKTQGGQVSLISNAGDINFLNSIIQTNGGSGLGGTISFDASRALTINGQLRANSQSSKAGQITLEANHILLDTQANIQATGATGGGNILVGGDWQGSGNLRQAITVTMNQGAIIDASATQNGNGGTVVLWSDIHNSNSVTTVNGSLLAKAGVSGGNGGQVETSGRWLQIGDAISVSTKAVHGIDGEWLLDPNDLWIRDPSWSGYNYSTSGTTTYTAQAAVVGGANSWIVQGAYTMDRGGGVTTLRTDTIVTALGQGNVRVLASGLIDVATWQASGIANYYLNSTTTNKLTLEAGTSIAFAGGTGTNSVNLPNGTLELLAGTTISQSSFVDTGIYAGTLILGKCVACSTNPSVTLTGPNNRITNLQASNVGALSLNNTTSTNINSSGLSSTGDISITSSSGISFVGVITTSGNITLSGALTLKNDTSLTSNGGVINFSSTINSDAAITPRTLTIDAGTGTITMSAAVGGTFALGSITATAATFNATSIALSSASTLSITNTANSAITGVISGSAALTKAGTGTLTLSGSNTYTGITTINGGVLSVSDLGGTVGSAGGIASGIGKSGNAATNLVINGGTLQYTGALASTDRLFTLGSNGGAIDASGSGALTWNGNGTGSANTLSITAATSPTLTLTGTGLGTFKPILANAATSGSTSLTKTGEGTWTLSVTNTYTGATNINNGVLKLATTTPFSAGTTIFVNVNGTLDVAGYVLTRAIRLNGGTVTSSTGTAGALAGSTTITLTANSSLTAATGATLSIGIANNSATINNGAYSITIGNANNAGLVIFSTANAYTQGTIVAYGTLQLSGSGTTAGTGTITVNSGATFDVCNIATANAINLNGGLYLASASNNTSSFTGRITLSADSTIASAATGGNYFNLSGGIDGSANLTIGTSGYRGIVFFSSATYSYTGVTAISYGTLSLVGSNTPTSLDTSSLVRIDPNGILGIQQSQTLSKAVTLNGGAIYGLGNYAKFNAAITLTDNSTIAEVRGSGFKLTLGTAAIISGNYGITIGASGYDATVNILGNNTYTGVTTIAYGTLQLGASGSGANSPLGTVDGGTVVNTGAVLDLNGINLVTAEPLTISGTGISNSGALMNGSTTAATYSGLLALGATSSVIGGSGTISLTNPGVITGAGFELKLGGTASGSSSISSIIGLGTGAVTKQDSGTWTLTGANTYTGITTLAGGILSVTLLDIGGNASSLGAASANASNLVFSGGALQYSGATAASTDRLFTVTATGATALTISTSSTGSLSFTNSGSIVNSASLANRLTLSANSATTITFNPIWGNPTTGAAALYTAGSGTVVLGGLNTYTGITSASAGTLSVSVLADGGQASSIGAAPVAAANLVLGGSKLIFTGVTSTTNRLFTIMNNLILDSGSGTLIFSNTNSLVNSYGASAAITLSGTGTATLNPVLPNNGSNVLSLTKSGTGTWTLAGANTYTGGTSISQGVLQFGTNTYFYCGGTQVCNASNTTISSGPVGTGSVTINSVTINNSSYLDLNGNGDSVSYGRFYNAITLNGSNGGYAYLINSSPTVSAASYGPITLTKQTTSAASSANNNMFAQAAGSATLKIAGVISDSSSGTYATGLSVGAATINSVSYSGTVIFSGINTYLNPGFAYQTVINYGTLQISGDSNLGGVGTAAHNDIQLLNGGTLLVSGQSGNVSIDVKRYISLGTGGGTIANYSSAYAVTLSSPISGSTQLTIGSTNNLGTIVLSGWAVTTSGSYTGPTSVTSGAILDLRINSFTTSTADPAFRSTYAGAGTIIIEPLTDNQTISLGGTGSTLNLPVYLFNGVGGTRKFADGLANIMIGSTSAGNVTVAGTATFTDSVTLLSGGNITINAGASVSTSQAAGNLVVAATGNFLNLAGSSALSTTDAGSTDRWIVYSANPSNANFGSSGTLVSGNKAYWGSTYASLAPSSIDAGNRYVFSIGGTVTVTTTSASMTYGLPIDLSSNYTVTVSNVSMNAAPTGTPYISNVASDLFATAPTITSTGNTALAAVGQYDITASGAVGATGFSTISYTNTGKLTVNPATITLGVVGTKTYDGSAIFNTGVTVNGLANGDTLGTATANSANVADNGSNYFVSFTLSSGTASNYVLVSGYNAATNAATINKASAYVLVTAGQSSTYGLTPTINYTFYSNAAGTGGSAISTSTSGTATITNAPTASSNAATYALTYASGLTADNYTLNPATSAVNYVVNKASAYVLVTAGQSSTYGLTPTINYTFYSNAAGTGGSAISTSTSGTATITNAPTATSNAATYALTYASGLSSTNYTFNPASGAVNYVVNRAPLVITGATKNLTYNGSAQTNSGGTFAVNGGSATAFSGTSLSTGIGSDGFTVAGYGTGTNANAYADNLSATVAGSTVAGNYSITYQNGSLTIDKANAYVLIAANQSSTYGASPTINYSYYSTASGTGGASITSPAGLAGSATITNAPTASSNAATYALTYASGLSSTNYLFNPATSAVDFVVNPAVLVITAPHTSVTYDGTLQSNSGGTFKLNGGTATAISNGTVSTGIGSESFDISGYGSGINASATAYADSLVATQGSGTLASNYSISYQHGSLTINKATIVVNSSNTTTTYDGTAKQNSATATVNGAATSFSSMPAGSSIISGGGSSAPLTNSTGVGNYIYLNTGLGLDAFTISGAAARTNVGTTADNFALTAYTTNGTLASNYDIVYNNRQLIVNPAPLGVSVSGTYSGSTTIAPTSFQFSGLVNNETVTALTSATVNNANVSSNGANYVTALVSGSGTADLSNYVITTGYHAGSVGTNTNGVFSGSTSGTATNAGGSNTATLNKADAYVLVTSGQSSVYGTAPTTINYTLNTSAAGNGSAITSPLGLSGSASFTGLPSASSVVNTYGVNYDTGLSATNYNFNPAASNTNFLVTRAALSITASAQSTTYGTALALGTNNTGATRYTVTGLVNSDAVTAVDLQYSGNATVAATTAANTYTNGIVASNATGTGLSNYTISYSPANLVVNTKALTITANADSKTYGTAKTYGAGSTAFTSSGLVNSETIATVTITDTNSGGVATANAGGTYALTPSAATGGTFTTSNYSITYTASALTVNKATLTVTADAKTMTYGGTSLPTLTTTIAGFVNSQNLGSSGVTGSASLSTTATAYDGSTAGSASVVGNYTITPTLGTLAATNYNFTYATGTLSVGKANLTITAANDSKTYGATTTAASVAYTSGVAANASTGYTTAGLVNGDTITDVTLTSTGANATATVAGGPYTITPSALTGSTRTTSANYNITYTNAATGLTVNPATLTYTATAATSIYGSTPSVNAGSVTGFVNGDTQGTATTGTLVFTTSATDHSNVGSYAINGSGLTSNTSNYVFAQAAGNATALTINPFAVIIEANRYYDGTRAISQVDFMVPGGLNTNGERVSVATGNATVSSANAGIYSNVTFSNLTIRVDDGFGGSRPTSNYTFNTTGVVQISPAPLTIRPDAKTMTYGGTVPNLTFTYTGEVAGETPNFTGSLYTYVNSTTNAGSHSIDLGTLQATGNYQIMRGVNQYYVTANVVVNPAPLNLSISKVYTGTTGFTSANTYTVTGMVNSDTAPLISGGSAATSSANAGTYNSFATNTLTSSNLNYTFVGGNITATVNPATLTLVATPTASVYGATPSVNAGSVTGFVNNETGTVLSGTLVFSTPATASSPIGHYAINGAGLSANNGNYVFVQAAANATALNIVQASIVITPNNQTGTYGTALNLGTTAFTATGLLNGDSLTGVTLLYGGNSVVPATLAAGTYTNGIVSSAATGSAGISNYSITYNTANLTINKATLTVSADNQTKTYGDVNPALTYTISGYVNNQNFGNAGITGTASTSTTARQGSDVGTYTISTVANNLAAANYDFSYTDGTLTVNRRPVTLTADNKSKTYGDVNPVLTYTVAANGVGSSRGLYGTDALTGDPATTATQATGVGYPAITQGGLTNTNNGNYAITFNNGTLTINPAQLTVTANADAKFVTQSDATNFKGVNYTGFVNGDTDANLTGVLTVTRTNFTQNNAGVYTGVLQASGLSSSNYTIAYANGNYTITPAQTLLVDVNNQNITYGAAPTFVIDSVKYLDGQSLIHTLTQDSRSGDTYTFSDGVGGSATFTLTTSAGLSSSNHLVVGNYSLLGANFSKVGTNFNNPPVYTGNLAVQQKALTAGTSSVSKVYDGSASMANLNISLNPIVSGDVVTASGQGAFSQAGVGSGLTYSVSNLALTGTDAGNYYLSGGTSFSGNNGEITKAPLGIAVTASYNGTTTVTPTAATLTGLVNNETLTVTSVGLNAANVAANTTNYVTAILASSGTASLDNYALNTARNATLATSTTNKVTLNPVAITVTANNQSRVYGAANPTSGAVTLTSGTLYGGDTLSTASLSSAAVSTTAAGQVLALVPTSQTFTVSNAAQNYTINYANGTLTVNKAPIGIQVAGTYNGTTTITPSSVTITGLANGETLNPSAVVVNDKNVAANGSNYVTAITPTAGDTAALSNYEFALAYNGASATTTTNAVTINKANLSVTATPSLTGNVYNGSAYTGAYTTTAVNGETFTVTGVATGTNAATYASNLVVTGAALDNYNTPIINNANLVISPKAVTITNAASSSTYDGVTSYAGLMNTAGFTNTALVGSDSIASVTQTATVSGSTVTGVAQAGTFVATPSVAVMGVGLLTNYAFTYQTATNTVAKANLSVTANNATKTYDGLVYTGGNGVTYVGLVGGEQSTVLGGLIAYNGTSQNAINAASYTIIPSGLTSNNYEISYTSGTLTINQKAITLRANAQSTTYGTALALGTLAYTISNGSLATGDAISAVTLQYNGNATVAATTNANTYASGIVASGATGTGRFNTTNYNITYAAGTLTVNKATLTVTADAQSRVYGDANPAFTETISGFVNGQILATSDVTGSAYGSTTATATSSIGPYTITASASGLTSNNYQFTTTNGTLTVNPRPITVTADAKTKVYGSANPALTYAVAADGVGTSRGLYGSDVLSGALSVNAGTATAVGNVAIAQNTLSNTNYAITYVAGNLSITPATLTVTGYKTYDGSIVIAGTDLTVTGVNGERFTAGGNANLISKNVQANQHLADVSGITLTPLGGALVSNYATLDVTNTQFTVYVKAVTLTAPSITKTYDGGYAYNMTSADLASMSTQLVGGDSVSAASVSYATNSAGPNKRVDLNSVTISDGNGGANYSVTRSYSSTSVINKAPLIIKAADDAKFVTTQDAAGFSGVYGDGFVNGEGLSNLTAPATIVTRSNASVNSAGNYVGVLVPGVYTSNNYNISYQNGTYTIVPAQTLLIRVAPTNVTYGAITSTSAPAYTYTAQYLPAATVNNPNPTPVSLATPAPVNGVYLINDNVGSTASFGIGAVNPEYSSTNRLAVGGYDMIEKNAVVTGGNFLSMLTVGALTVAPKVISATNLGIAGMSKVYDGSAAISGALLNVNSASSQLLSGDVVNVYATGSYDDANVGSAKSIVVDVSLSTPSNLTNDAANYSLSSTRVTGNLGAITQLAQVTWTGGGSSNNWSNASNWLNGAIPTFSIAANLPNVANVIIPAGANVVYDSASMGNSGSAITNNGTITFNGANNFTWTDNVSGAGNLSLTGAGTLTLAGNNTYSGGTNIHSSTLMLGAVNALAGNVLTTSGGKLGLVNGITLPGLTVNGDLTLVSDMRTSGAQIYNGQLGLGQSLSLTASAVTFNDAVGKVMLSNQSGTYDYKTNDYYNIYTNLHRVNGVDVYNLAVLADSVHLNADVVTYGTQTYGSSTRLTRVIIGDNGRNGTTRVLVSEDPAVTFWGTVDDAVANTHDLVVKAVTYTGLETPTIDFNGNVGAIAMLKSLTTEVGSQETIGTPVFAKIAVGSGSALGTVTINGTVTTAATVAQAAAIAAAAKANQANGSGAGWLLKQINRNYEVLPELKLASVEVGEATLFDSVATKVETTLCIKNNKLLHECGEEN